MARRRIKYYTIEGTSLKYSQTMYNKIQKGTVSVQTLAKNIAERNPLALDGLFTDAKKEFTRLSNKDFVKTPDDLFRAIRTAYRSALYNVDKGRLLAENMKDIVDQVMDDTNQNKMMQELGMKDVNFDDWTWNEGLKRLESPDGQYWIKLDNNNSSDYGAMQITYGTV